jgi:iron complex transport system substrate-binding protein
MKKKTFKSIALLLVATMVLAIAAGCAKPGIPKDDIPEGENEINSENNVQDGGQENETDQEQQVDSEEDNGADSFPVEVVDSKGRTVRIEKAPESVASLAPHATEILFELGLGDKIIGVSEYCDYPEEAVSKDKLGDYWQPNIELIVEAEPDILFVGKAASEDFLIALEENGIIAVALEGSSLEETYETILSAGKITGTHQKAQEVVGAMKEKAAEIKKKLEDVDRVKSYFVISYGDQGDFTAGAGSFIDEMITLAGGENIAGDMEQEWAEYSIEKLVEKQPDIILSTIQAKPEGIAETPGYKELNAIKEGRLVVLDDNLVNRAGPRIVEGLEEMAKGIHPDLFK